MDLSHECRAIESNMASNPELSLFNLASGQQLVWIKFPDWLLQKWHSYGHDFMMKNFGSSPPFAALVTFLQSKAEEMNNPNFEKPHVEVKSSKSKFTGSMALKTVKEPTEAICVFHGVAGHSLTDCQKFGKLPFFHKRKFARGK